MAHTAQFATRRHLMVNLAPYLVAGIVIVMLLDYFNPAWLNPLDWSSQNPSALTLVQTADRYGRGDRLPFRAENGPIATVVAVEIVGLRDAAIVYRDRNGRTLFRSDPLTNTTIVAKNADLPEVTVRDRKDIPVRPIPIEVFPSTTRQKLPIGCDSSVGPLAEHSAGTLASRCMTESAGAPKFAVLG
jgi:hypothetical protein